jgi:alkylation response protein AidB-like acyl-CoA dehydrogenase
MSLAFTEEQKQIKETAQRFFTENAPVEALRQLRDSKDATGYSSELWQQMAELGFAGINVP